MRKFHWMKGWYWIRPGLAIKFGVVKWCWFKHRISMDGVCRSWQVGNVRLVKINLI